MGQENADKVRIWDGVNLSARLLVLSSASVSEMQTLTALRIWNGLHLTAALFVLRSGSVWEWKTLW